MNMVSISLLLICSVLECFAKLWTNFLCLEFGQLENLSSISFGAMTVLLTLPLFTDVSYILLQRVHPIEVSTLVERELRQLEASHKEDNVFAEEIQWQLWSLDKSFRVASIKATVTEHVAKSVNEVEKLRQEIEKCMSRYC